MHPKDADGMANSVDPDQTASSEAVWSWSAMFAETYLSQYIEFVRYKQCSIDVHETSRCIDVDATFSRHCAFTETTLWARHFRVLLKDNSCLQPKVYCFP